MKAYFSFLSSAGEKLIAILAIISLLGVIYPAATNVAHAKGTSSALVFEIDSNTISKINKGLTFQEVLENDILVAKVKAYLEAKKSPLAPYADQIVLQPQWQRALAISYVESNFGQRCADNNCSGIGVHPSHPSWRKYPTKLEWFKDMTQLLEKPIYKNKYTTCAKMKGIYVVPGSARWVNGCNKVISELNALVVEAEAERIALANASTLKVSTSEIELIK